MYYLGGRGQRRGLHDLVLLHEENGFARILDRRLAVHLHHILGDDARVRRFRDEGHLQGEEIARNGGTAAELHGAGLVGGIDDGDVPLEHMLA